MIEAPRRRVESKRLGRNRFLVLRDLGTIFLHVKMDWCALVTGQPNDLTSRKACSSDLYEEHAGLINSKIM